MPDPQAADGRDPPAKNRRRKLGEMLVDAGILSPDQLEEALRRQKVEKGTRLGRLLVDLGFATETQICEIVADQLRIPAADMVAVDVAEDVLAKLTRELAVKHTCLPWFVEGRELYLIMADPTNVAAADAVAFHSGLRVKPVVAPESEVLAAINRFYAGEEQSLAQFDNLALADQLSVVAEQDVDLGEEDAAQPPWPARPWSSSSTRCSRTRSRRVPRTSTWSRTPRAWTSATAWTVCSAR